MDRARARETWRWRPEATDVSAGEAVRSIAGPGGVPAQGPIDGSWVPHPQTQMTTSTGAHQYEVVGMSSSGRSLRQPGFAEALHIPRAIFCPAKR